jgi:spermidine/putrescine transport system substrate-binding protein
MRRRAFLKQGSAIGATAALPGFAWGQSTPTLEILLANALVSGPLKGILEKEAHIKINDAPFQSSTDVVSRLVAPGGTSRYNLMMSHSIFSRGPVLGERAGAEKATALDLKKVPNVSQVADTFKPDFLERDGKIYGIPIMWGYDSVLYNTKEVKGDDPSWGMIFDDKYAGRIGWQDASPHMLLAAGLFLGHKSPETMTSAELNELGKFMTAKKKNVRTIWTSFAQCSNLLATGEVVTTFGPIPVRYGLQQKDQPITNAWCKEGVLSFVQPAYIPKDSSNQDAAHRMINAMLGQTYASQLSPACGYLSTSKLGARDLSSAERTKWGYGILDGSTKHHPLRMPADLNQWLEVWTRIKAA